MAFEIIWTAEAENDVLNIIDYLRDNWSISSVEKFVDNLNLKIERLIKMPSLGRTTSKSYYIYKLDKKNALFFQIKNKRLILLSIYPYSKDITKSKYY